jgi:hypothetical protein
LERAGILDMDRPKPSLGDAQGVRNVVASPELSLRIDGPSSSQATFSVTCRSTSHKNSNGVLARQANAA